MHPLNIANPVRVAIRASETNMSVQKPTTPPPQVHRYTEQPKESTPVEPSEGDRIGGLIAIGVFLVCTILLVLFMRQEHYR